MFLHERMYVYCDFQNVWVRACAFVHKCFTNMKSATSVFRHRYTQWHTHEAPYRKCFLCYLALCGTDIFPNFNPLCISECACVCVRKMLLYSFCFIFAIDIFNVYTHTHTHSREYTNFCQHGRKW